MKLLGALSLALLCPASAYVRIAGLVPGHELVGTTFKDEIQRQQHTNQLFGKIQLIGGCCGVAKGDALLAQTAVNTNDIYGATADVLEAQLNQETGCHVVKDYSKNGDPDCQYVMVFEDKIAPLNQLAANCVPATICEPDVVGMTKGKIATYGVVMQVLQKNLGQLIWLGQGDPATCLQRMTEVNSGDLSKVFKMHTVQFLGMHWQEKKMDIDGMRRLGAMESLGDCRDNLDGSPVSYLFIHKNLLWDGDEEIVSVDHYMDYKDAKERATAEKEIMKDAAMAFAHRRLAEVVV